MLRVTCHNVMGRLTVNIVCLNHGDTLGHSVWTGSRRVGPEDPRAELGGITNALREAERAYSHGEWEWSLDC